MVFGQKRFLNITSFILRAPDNAVPVITVPWPRIEKQWSTEKMKGPVESRFGLYVEALRTSISLSIPSAPVSGA